MEKIRVLIVDDSAFMRKVIAEILESDHRIQVIGTARNGRDGIEKVTALSPDVVTMDVNMPELDGISALREIMRSNPVPIIMLSSVMEDGAEDTIKALEYGAVDFITKPSGAISLDIRKKQKEIIAKVIAAKEATLSIPRTKKEIRLETKKVMKTGRTVSNQKTMIAIGASTGGPRAIQKVLTELPADFKPPIFIVQHMPPAFTASLAKRLNTLTSLYVKEADHGEKVQESTVYIAPGDRHMKVEKVGNDYVIQLTKDPPINNHRPSVDALFYSIADLKGVKKIAVVLTGMGNDGAKGIEKIKRMDGQAITIAESEETSVIYGMPKAAFMTNMVDEVLPLDQIAGYLESIS